MNDVWEEMIRRRAYDLWEHAGCTGSAEGHWLRAEEELKTNSGQVSEPQVRANSAADWGERLRPFYETLSPDLAPREHWELAIEIALGRDELTKS